MKKKLLIILIFLITSNLFAQHKDIYDSWILLRTAYNTGKFLEVNHPLYSRYERLDILPYSIKVNGIELLVRYSKHQIKAETRTINYRLENNLLITFDEGNTTTNVYMKLNDFIEKNPEFAMKMIYRNGNFVFVDNGLSAYKFDNELSQDEFISFLMKPIYKINSKNPSLKIEFILTKDHKVIDINPIGSCGEEFDKEYIANFKKSLKYLKNLTNSDLLITKKVNFRLYTNKKTTKNDKLFFNQYKKANDLYKSHKFAEAIEAFIKIEELNINIEEFNDYYSDIFLKMGISYILVGKKEEACNLFYALGNKSNFYIRNYILDFCEKDVDTIASE